MKTPVHRAKEFVVYGEGFNGKPPHWTHNSVRGWLGSDVKDCNGVEIFEGDIVKHIIPPNYVQDDNLYIVYFRRCSFLLIAEKDWDYRENCGATPLGWQSSASIEVIGHIAEESDQCEKIVCKMAKEL